MISRDEVRLQNVRSMINTLPLGSAALSGSSLKLDRAMVAKNLVLIISRKIRWTLSVIETM